MSRYCWTGDSAVFGLAVSELIIQYLLHLGSVRPFLYWVQSISCLYIVLFHLIYWNLGSIIQSFHPSDIFLVVVDPVKKFRKAKLNWSYVPVTMISKDHMRKIDKPGKVFFVAYNDDLITYSEGGLGTINVHLQTLKYFKCVAALAKNQLLLGINTHVSETMYEAPPTYYTFRAALSSTTKLSFKPLVHILDRVANMEDMLVTFIVEHSCHFLFLKDWLSL